MSGKEDTYFQSNKTRPVKNLSVGSGKFCCVPDCKSSTTSSTGEKTGISLFQIPTKEPDKTNWIKALSQVRRKGGNDSFDPRNKTYYVCEFHFKAEDIRVTAGIGRKKYRDGKIPTIFPSKPKESKPKRKAPTPRPAPVVESSESVYETDSDEDQFMEIDNDEPAPVPELSENEQLRLEIQQLRLQLQTLQMKYDKAEEEKEYFKSRMYNFENISKNEKSFRKATGLHVDKFDAILEFINPGKDSCNIKMYDTSKRLSEEALTSMEDEYLNKPGRTPMLDTKEQFFLYLTWLKNGFHLEHAAWLFGLTTSTVSRYIITWSNLLYFSLGSLPIWPTREQINEKMPDSFKRTYSTTRCIIDCTELYCQRPSSLATQSSLYSHYKSHATYKGLVGITPDGSISFVSQLFDGSISDKAIVKQSGFLDNSFVRN